MTKKSDVLKRKIKDRKLVDAFIVGTLIEGAPNPYERIRDAASALNLDDEVAERIVVAGNTLMHGSYGQFLTEDLEPIRGTDMPFEDILADWFEAIWKVFNQEMEERVAEVLDEKILNRLGDEFGPPYG